MDMTNDEKESKGKWSILRLIIRLIVKDLKDILYHCKKQINGTIKETQIGESVIYIL